MTVDLERQLRAYGEMYAAHLEAIENDDAATRASKDGVTVIRHDVVRSPSRPSPRLGLAVAAGVLAFGLLVILGVVGREHARPFVSADDANAAVAPVAEAMERSPEATRSLFTPSGVFHVGGTSWRVDSPAAGEMIEFRIGLGTTYSVEACSQEGRVVRCRVAISNALVREAGLVLAPVLWALTFTDDGLVETFTETYTPEVPEVEEAGIAFHQWICEHHYQLGLESVWEPTPGGYDCSSRNWSFFVPNADPEVILDLHHEYLTTSG